MNYVVEMGSDSVIYIPNFINIFSRHSKVEEGGYT
jgi:hypothetical protein